MSRACSVSVHGVASLALPLWPATLDLALLREIKRARKCDWAGMFPDACVLLRIVRKHVFSYWMETIPRWPENS